MSIAKVQDKFDKIHNCLVCAGGYRGFTGVYRRFTGQYRGFTGGAGDLPGYMSIAKYKTNSTKYIILWYVPDGRGFI